MISDDRYKDLARSYPVLSLETLKGAFRFFRLKEGDETSCLLGSLTDATPGRPSQFFCLENSIGADRKHSNSFALGWMSLACVGHVMSL